MYNNILWWEPITCHEHTQLGPWEAETWRPVDTPVATKGCHVVGPWKPVHGIAFQGPFRSNDFDSYEQFSTSRSWTYLSPVAQPLCGHSFNTRLHGTFQVAEPSRLGWLLSSMNPRNTWLSEDCRGNKALEDAESSEVTCKYLKLNKNMQS